MITFKIIELIKISKGDYKISILFFYRYLVRLAYIKIISHNCFISFYTFNDLSYFILCM